MTEALKPCPFCGDKRVAIHSDHDPDDFGRFYMVRCHGCGAQSQGVFASHGNDCPLHYEEVRDAWNRRPEPAPASIEARDSERLDWVVRQADEFSCSIIQDAPGDGEYLVHGMKTSGQGKTARDAIDAAMSAPASQARPAGGSEGGA